MRSKKPALLSIITLTTVTIIFWIAYEVYLILTTKPPATVDPALLEPISPVLDLDILDDLSGRMFFEEGKETGAVFAPPPATPTPTPIQETPISVSPSPTPSPEPTP